MKPPPYGTPKVHPVLISDLPALALCPGMLVLTLREHPFLTPQLQRGTKLQLAAAVKNLNTKLL